MLRKQRRLRLWFDTIDVLLTSWMARNALGVLRLLVGLIFLWFGALKLMPGTSLAESGLDSSLTFLPMGLILPLLAVWELAIGISFISGRWIRVAILLLLLQLPALLLLSILAPAQIWASFPFVLTLEGQNIIKHVVLIAAGLVIGSTVRGGGLIADPVILAEADDHAFARSFVSTKS